MRFFVIHFLIKVLNLEFNGITRSKSGLDWLERKGYDETKLPVGTVDNLMVK